MQKMNQVTMEKDKELASLKKKLEGMVKLNQALTTERSELLSKVKKMVIIIIYYEFSVNSFSNIILFQDEGVNGV